MMWSTKEQFNPINIPGTVSGASQGILINHSPGRDLIVLLHATGNDKFYPWSPVIREILNHNVQILIFDLPGHGSHSTDILSEKAYNCVENALREANKITHWSRVFGIGQSLGGMLLLRAACSGESRFEKISLWGVPDGKSVSPAAFLELSFLLNPNFWRLATDYGFQGLFPAFMSYKRNHYPVRCDGKNYIFQVLKLLRSEAVKIDPQKAPPTQFLIGNLDYLASRELPKRLSKSIKYTEVASISECHFSTMFSRSATQKALAWFES